MHRPDSPQMAPWPLSWIPRPRKRSKAVPHTFPVFCSILRCCNEHRSKSQNGGSTSFVFHTFRVKSGQSSSSASLHHHPGVLFLFRFVVLGSNHLFYSTLGNAEGLSLTHQTLSCPGLFPVRQLPLVCEQYSRRLLFGVFPLCPESRRHPVCPPPLFSGLTLGPGPIRLAIACYKTRPKEVPWV